MKRFVALHPEGVDRNQRDSPLKHAFRLVALHPEGVDRNWPLVQTVQRKSVALHPEGVDRNSAASAESKSPAPSPSTRRAWIEIPCDVPLSCVCESPSTRRAWIEITAHLCCKVETVVALHPEGVDRNSLSQKK